MLQTTENKGVLATSMPMLTIPVLTIAKVQNNLAAMGRSGDNPKVVHMCRAGSLDH